MRPKRKVLVVVLDLVILIAPLFALPPLAGASDSQRSPVLAHARVVSLSLVDGTVIVRKPGSAKWSRAGLDLSIEEGMSIATARNSFAEVQFENGCTLRIGEVSRVDFTQMALGPRGGKVDHITLAFGRATANVTAGRHDEYVLRAGDANVIPAGASEFRIDLGHTLLRVEVFRGHLEAANTNESTRLHKNQILTGDDSSRGPFQISSPIHMDAWDQWVSGRDEQAALRAYQDNAAMDAVLNDWSHVVPPPGLLTGGIVDDGF